MKNLYFLVLIGGLFAAACGSSPTAPSNTTPAPTQTFTLRGQVTSTAGGPISGATVAVADGTNAGKSATTDGAGNYAIASLARGGFTVNISAKYFFSTAKPVTLISDTTLDAALAPTPVFAQSGIGDTVFDMPTTVARIRITGRYTGGGSNFVVYIAGRLIVNEIIGTRWPSTTFEGTYLTNGGVVQITNSSGVAWSFTEVRP